MNARYIDAHCHVQFGQYAKDEAEIIARMKDEGVVGIVVGANFESSQKALALAEKYEHLFAAVGLHPNDIDDETFDDAAYRALARHPKVVAVGECGLDYFRPVEINDEVKNNQKEVFRKHVALASLLDKPLTIHARPSKGTQDAYHDIAEILKEEKAKYPNLRGDMHFFVGGVEEAQTFISLGFTLSFTAVITFARDYDAVIQNVPLASILSETDAPYVAPLSRRGQRNDPLAVIDVVAKIAELRGEKLEDVRAALLNNAGRMFGLAI
ncbi:MAG: TatD family hydrolase [Minisyncoccia bacterium]